MRDWVYGFFMAWGMFLAIPCPKKIWSETARRKMLACLPLAGAVVGAVWALCAWLAWYLPHPLGAALCAERERRGLSLDDVAAHLKISTRLIQALESGDLSALPHPAYTKGFLRAYASYMALDPEAVAEVAHALQPAAATELSLIHI
mgnify:CR=1 FL=1